MADRGREVLSIQWADGHASAYSFAYLRWNCPCAECAGEWGAPGRLATITSLARDQTAMTGIEPVGLFGVRPAWKDGHDTGIYGLKLLRALCPCDECAPALPATVRREPSAHA